ncbi:hypothetical protein EDC02_6266 [Micromonospora sp. Llam0]|uniref:hypothetical protein n=1 Tax=Micromonospora sp. Llam0 TaxID=2485143 RepID=UPI000F9BAD29|nr:hypothetical protein [Micromonospora sp. Llam0]ROO51391.1 hypothetical protein EDC02_6266 [Micromonospora sp. Llam0]
MRTLARVAVTAAMVVGAMAATGTAAVAADSSSNAQVSASASAAAIDVYYGYGSGSSASSAVYNARYQAELWAQIDGYTPFIDCYVSSSYVNQISDYYYTANVTLICY